MANVRGMSATTDVASQDRVVDMAKKVIMLEPDKNQMVKFVDSLGVEVTHNPEFHWQTDQIVQFIDQVSGTVADANDNTIPVDNGDRWLPNDVILVTSGTSAGEVMRVTSISSNTLTVERNVAGTGTSMADNDYLLKVSSSWGEGSSVRDSNNAIISLQTAKADNYNYAQVEKTVVSLTASQEAYSGAGGHHSGDARKYDQARAGMEHAKKMNQTCYFGKRAASGNTRYTGGFIEFITRTAGTTSLTHANIDTDVNTFMRYGSSKKKLFTTRRVSGKISKLAADKIEVQGAAQAHAGMGDIDKGAAYGARIRTFIADGGEFEIIVDDTLGDIAAYLGYGLFIDPMDVKRRVAPGRDTKLHLDAQLPDVDGKVDYYLTEWGLQRGNASHHGMWTAVAA